MTTLHTLGRRDAGLGRVDYSQAPRAVYFVASTGDRWRVHDCRVELGRVARVGLPGMDGATHRVFVAPGGEKKVYRRLPGEVWRETAAQLDRQLVAAQVIRLERSRT